MEDPSFKLGNVVHVFNVILNYMYLGLLIMCFLLSLGNRPQGAKWFYTMAFIGFALVTVYMTVSSSLTRRYALLTTTWSYPGCCVLPGF